MALSYKTALVDFIEPDKVLARTFNDASPEGMDSAEESDLDQQLENSDEESR